MRALTVEPSRAGSLRVDEDPVPGPGDLLVTGLALGVCGTDREIVRGAYGRAPPGGSGWCWGTSRSAGCVKHRRTAASPRLAVDAGGVNRELVLENDVVVGSVNANLRHYRQAVDVLVKADISWLQRLITRRVSLADAAGAFETGQDVKVVVLLDENG